MDDILKTRYLIKHRQSSEIWNFFLENQCLYYKVVNKNLPEEKLIENVLAYDICLDSKDVIHLVCITTKGKMYYFNYSNNTWNKMDFKKIINSFNKIDYIKIAETDGIIHVFYGFNNAINKNFYRIIYIYYDGLKWKYSNIDSNLPTKNSIPFFIDYDKKGDLYFAFKNVKAKKITFNIQVFSSWNKHWTNLSTINLNEEIKDVKSFLVDSNLNFHILYTYNNKAGLFHSFLSEESLFKFSSLIFMEENEKQKYKFFQIENKLWIVWKFNGTIYYTYSDDFGVNWYREAFLLENDFYDINYIGQKYKNTDILKKISTFGYVNMTDTTLLGIDNIEKFLSGNDLKAKSNLTEYFSEKEDTNKNVEKEVEKNQKNKPFIEKIIDFLINK
ncbi:hypothetical protein SAMN02745883_00510 [Caminicella sporogenes DSM 14501]|uniref:BNR repeat-containing family member n=1 Tax=Caminicella sporogenes DSM 14501 TaxID=1121266 RepID=A0A1M6MEV8_9FIRM|nr:hypothetical protein [Caminicella sporogenes]RKD27581.1 hypothetical protein BET04_00485 [Caminicella sporogenes]SHJ81880.1 hypothetical protein SAMN02745883_00510 [Caminicella sporogenes DSM 14501]